MDQEAKLEAIRAAEEVSIEEFSLLSGLGVRLGGAGAARASSVAAGLEVLFAQPRFFKYVHWFLRSETLPVIGQISPAIESSRRRYRLPASISGYLLATRIANRPSREHESEGFRQ